MADPRLYDTVKHDLLQAKNFISANKTPTLPSIQRELINSEENFVSWMELLAIDPNIKIYADIETTGLVHFRDKIISMSLVFEIDGQMYGIAFLTQPKEGWWWADFTNNRIFTLLQTVLGRKRGICFHNSIFDLKFLWEAGFIVKCDIDTIDQHLVIDENHPHGLKYLVTIYNSAGGGYQSKLQDDIGEEGVISDASPEILLDYNLDDSYHGFVLEKKFSRLMEEEKMTDFFNKLAMPLKRTLTKVSYRGIKMDRQGIIDLSNKYRGLIIQGEQKIKDLLGTSRDINYGPSSKELATILYKELNLPIVGTTEKGSPSTNKAALEILATMHEFPKLVTQLRFYKNMLVKYLDGDDGNKDPKKQDKKLSLGMLHLLDSRDRIHGNFLTSGTISGRPSCTKPNLLNIPKNPEIRNLFITDEGWSFIDIDYSQAELVVLAYLSGDPGFIKAVNETDLHMGTAKGLMGIENPDDEVRRRAKAINFLKAYGGGAAKLAANLKIDVDAAREWLNKWDRAFPKVPQYKSEQQLKWKRDGFIMGLYGRKKRFPKLGYFDSEMESYYDRISVNFMCQNAVSETLNRSMVDVDHLLDSLFGWSPKNVYNIPGIVLGVYDNMITETPDCVIEEIKDIMTTCMAFEIPGLNLSLKFDVNVSKRWGQKLEKKKEPDPVEAEQSAEEDQQVMRV